MEAEKLRALVGVVDAITGREPGVRPLTLLRAPYAAICGQPSAAEAAARSTGSAPVSTGPLAQAAAGPVERRRAPPQAVGPFESCPVRHWRRIRDSNS